MTARTPEELDRLFEDALLIHDDVRDLFETRGVLVAYGSEVRGAPAIARAALTLDGYVADPRQVVQVRDTALIVGSSAISVVRRAGGTWRFVVTIVNHNTKDRT